MSGRSCNRYSVLDACLSYLGVWTSNFDHGQILRRKEIYQCFLVRTHRFWLYDGSQFFT